MSFLYDKIIAALLMSSSLGITPISSLGSAVRSFDATTSKYAPRLLSPCFTEKKKSYINMPRQDTINAIPIDLQSFSPQDATTNEDTRIDSTATTHSLPPADTGKAAYRLLFAAFIFEALLWGFPLSFGIFQEYYSSLLQFRDSPYVSVIGTVASGISYLAAPIIIPLVKRYAKYRRHMIWTGWMLALLSLVAGSFAESLGTLILTQGVLYGFGFVIFYYPILNMVNEFWIERRGFAYGILCGASGVSGAVLPIALQALLRRYGYATTLRIVAVGLLVLTGPLIPLLKGRVPNTDVEATASVRTNWSFLRAPMFWIYSLSNLAMGLGYFFPSIYLPSYAVSVGLGPTQGALLLTLMSVSQVLGQSCFGYLSDKSRVPLSLLVTSSALAAGVAAYACWGLAETFGVLAVFAMVYGFFGAGYTALWGRMGLAVTSDSASAFAAFGLLNLGKGVGNILAGPIGGSLLRSVVQTGSYGVGKFEPIVLFTGSCMIASAVTIGLQYLKH